MQAVEEPFRFKQFDVQQNCCAMKVGTDGVLLGAWTTVVEKKNILDIGAGTGVIAIMLAQRNAQAQVVGVEIDEAACEEAASNMKGSPFSDRLSMVNSPIQDYSWNKDGSFDLIVSNPPFFSGGTLSFAGDRNEVRHTIKLSHGDLIQSVKRLLHPAGTFCVILPHIEGLRFLEFAQRAQLYPQRITEVLPREGKEVNRLLIALGRERVAYQTDQLIIRAEGTEEYTESYKELTKAFYLNF